VDQPRVVLVGRQEQLVVPLGQRTAGSELPRHGHGGEAVGDHRDERSISVGDDGGMEDP
jgi:hypothetical protein